MPLLPRSTARAALGAGLLAGCPLPTGESEEEPIVDHGGEISESEFVSTFKRHFCDVLYECNPDLSCDASRFKVPEACTYDPQRARACLEGEFTCTDAYGLEFVQVPPACLLVFSCPYASGSGLFTGTGTGGGGSAPPTTYYGYY